MMTPCFIRNDWFQPELKGQIWVLKMFGMNKNFYKSQLVIL